MTVTALVFVDTNVLKFAATELVRLRARRDKVQWGPLLVDLIVHDAVAVNPNDRIPNAELRTEADLLPSVAACGKTGLVEFVHTVEALYESWGLPSMDSETGAFYGANIRLLQNVPFSYGRVMSGFGVDGEAEQLRFISSIGSPRFFELQRACGAFQGRDKPLNKNQLLDAFHIWCAELAGCSYFLTLDFKLQRTLSLSAVEKKVNLVRPTELLAAIQPSTRP